MELTTRWHTVEGLRALDVSAAGIRATVLPDLGGKIISLRSDPAGHEFLAQTPARPLTACPLDTAFAAGIARGWDECFPNIGPGLYPLHPWTGAVLADHGEIWTAEWECETTSASVTLSTYGVRFPYHFQKALQPIGEGRWQFRYALTNLTAFPLRYIWASHPLFAAGPGSRIWLSKPGPVSMALSLSDDLGPFMGQHPWPETRSPGNHRINLETLPAAPTAHKFFTAGNAVDRCALYDPVSGCYVGFVFDPREVTHLGIWCNSGAWPEGEGVFHIALEPGRGRPDWLETAIVSGEACMLPPRSEQRWSFTLSVGVSGAFDDVGDALSR